MVECFTGDLFYWISKIQQTIEYVFFFDRFFLTL
jgi:hypothetical protein